ncbi:hypothetical protein ACFWTE_06170 [Nocardiopsis sp. NPDC058631]|uniref:hypothetical protein n=1 Tax=Nocardiopsis sp. NPDC058631 TaxID=3346566 RepID=UPI0036693B8A
MITYVRALTDHWSQPGCRTFFPCFGIRQELGRLKPLLSDDVAVLVQFTVSDPVTQSVIDRLPEEPTLLVPFVPGTHRSVGMAAHALYDELSVFCADQDRTVLHPLEKGADLRTAVLSGDGHLSREGRPGKVRDALFVFGSVQNFRGDPFH